jgi:hypothetical protein
VFILGMDFFQAKFEAHKDIIIALVSCHVYIISTCSVMLFFDIPHVRKHSNAKRTAFSLDKSSEDASGSITMSGVHMDVFFLYLCWLIN